ncbi:MAG: hypothetical protein LQ351_002507 [Letrouitia transgressa]|nr:MAG: hypothetical protein LQ351_002507 [Letrouitia transgressa]
MDASDSDEDMRRAIQLSLEFSSSRTQATHRVTSQVPSVIDLVSDEEIEPATQQSDARSAEPPPPTQGILGLDRKAMERERLARKRKASISPPISPSISQKTARRYAEYMARPQHQLGKVAKPLPSERLGDHSSPTIGEEISAQTSSIRFPNGAVKKTWAFGHERVNDIKLEEVLQRDSLQLAVFSSFQWDVEWLLRKINTKRTQIVFVMGLKGDEAQEQYREDSAGISNLRLCFPSMEGQINCMHSKLMLLSHETHLRVVVPTANLVPYDWGESGLMENTLFIIDLPRLPNGQSIEESRMTKFGKDLIYFLKAMSLDKSIIESIPRFDLAATKGLAFVHTIGGAHLGEDEPWRRTGYCGLGKAIKELDLDTEAQLALDFVTSSVGSINLELLATLYLAAQGSDGMTEYGWRYSHKAKASQEVSAENKKSKFSEMNIKTQAQTGTRIYFPTEDTVRRSKGGITNAGTICFQEKWWNSSNFPRQVMRDCISQRPGMLMHNKVSNI